MKKDQQREDWRDELRGSYGNTGRLSRAGYNVGGLGAAGAGAAPEATGAEEEESSKEGRVSSTGRWAERLGPRGFSGGFAGREYSWTRRGDQPSR